MKNMNKRISRRKYRRANCAMESSIKWQKRKVTKKGEGWTSGNVKGKQSFGRRCISKSKEQMCKFMKIENEELIRLRREEVRNT